MELRFFWLDTERANAGAFSLKIWSRLFLLFKLR